MKSPIKALREAVDNRSVRFFSGTGEKISKFSFSAITFNDCHAVSALEHLFLFPDCGVDFADEAIVLATENQRGIVLIGCSRRLSQVRQHP